VALSPPLSPLIIKGFPHEISTPQLTKQRKKKKRETLVVCVSVMLASTLRLARRARTTHATPTSAGEAALFYFASSQQQRLFDFVRVIISFAFSLNRFLRCVFWKKEREREREREGKTKKKGRSRARLFFLNLKRLLFFTFAIDRASTLLTLARFFYFTHHTLFLCSFLRNEKKTKQDLYFRRFRVAVKFEER